MAINEVRVQGGITREPENGYGQATGTPYWKSTLAVNGARYDSAERKQVVTTTFVSVVAFGWKAEQMMNEGLGKGDELFVRGELDQQTWENKEKDKTEHSTKVRIESYDVVRRTGRRQASPTGATATATATVVQPPPGEDPWARPLNSPADTEPPF